MEPMKKMHQATKIFQGNIHGQTPRQLTSSFSIKDKFKLKHELSFVYLVDHLNKA